MSPSVLGGGDLIVYYIKFNCCSLCYLSKLDSLSCKFNIRKRQFIIEYLKGRTFISFYLKSSIKDLIKFISQHTGWNRGRIEAVSWSYRGRIVAKPNSLPQFPKNREISIVESMSNCKNLQGTKGVQKVHKNHTVAQSRLSIPGLIKRHVIKHLWDFAALFWAVRNGNIP